MIVTDNLRIAETHALIPPAVLLEETPLTDNASLTVSNGRQDISNILNGKDDRLVVITGPCSVHDLDAVVEYGQKLKEQINKHKNHLCIIMRVYFEKPRTRVGWKGFINDPELDNSFKINKGLRLARKLLLKLTDNGVACGTEFLDVISPQYITDLISWGAIGARTTESQVHRELASGLSCPIGFKNGTDGNIKIALDAIQSSHSAHHFLSVTKYGNTAIFKTTGNLDTHIILRGGKSNSNYSLEDIEYTNSLMAKENLPQTVMIDFSHGNSKKDYRKQIEVARVIAEQISKGSYGIFGAMIESFLVAGNQKISKKPLTYGQSITDACISWQETEDILSLLAKAVQDRRNCRTN